MSRRIQVSLFSATHEAVNLNYPPASYSGVQPPSTVKDLAGNLSEASFGSGGVGASGVCLCKTNKRTGIVVSVLGRGDARLANVVSSGPRVRR